MFISNNRHGIVPRRQVGTVPGQHGSSHVTSTSDSRHEAGMGQGRATSYNIRKLHWNAEGVRNKNLELQALLNERNIDVCCIQETHLNSCDPFSIRGFRRDRTDRTQGGILTLVKNTHAVAEVYRSKDEVTEVLGIKVLLDKIPSQSTISTPHPTNSCVPKFFSLTQTDGLSWAISTATPPVGAMMILIMKEKKKKTGSSHTLWCSSTSLMTANFLLQRMGTTGCPDLAIATDDVAKITSREVDKQLHLPHYRTPKDTTRNLRKSKLEL